MNRLRCVVALASFTCICVGCSNRAPDMPDVGRVYGTVTLDGEPVPNVSIFFKPDVGRQSIARADEKGEYEAMYLIDEAGVKVGPCTVSLEWAPDDSGPAIPAKYGYKSELKLDVNPGRNLFNIEMKSD